MLIRCDKKTITLKHNQIYHDNYVITDFKDLLENYKIKGSISNLTNGVFNFSKSTFCTALKVSTIMSLVIFVYIAECTLLPKDILKVIGIDITDTTSDHFCPSSENVYNTIMEVNIVSFLIASTIGAIQFFHGN